ncbi:class I SAM-dependent methyltransferase [Chitinimonas lacunae]|uniref:Class I SAM-dependent methyltransferase n=1 Tax=Chitinimonas lacunae TaxID=1963018 RepID=A0ABV8MXU8_9NEIS
MSPVALALPVQLGAAALALLLVKLFGLAPAWWLAWQPVLALGLALLARQPLWWWPIHLGFAPALAWALARDWSPWWYLTAFGLAFLIFGPVARSRVPLYLSNRRALGELASRIPPGARVLDVGAGTGTVLAWLARRGVQVDGIEHAWVPWAIGRLRLLGQRGARLLYGDWGRYSFADYDIVYAFLSPAAMESLWHKVRRELRPGALLISNSFAVPGVPADEVIELDDWKGARLYLWRMP